MKGTLLLNYDENTKIVEEEEKNRFLYSLLEQIGIPVNDFWKGEISLSIDQKIRLRTILSTYNIQVIDDLDGNMQVYIDNELVGEWHKCTYKLKKDLRQLDPKKRIYLEMQIDYWSIFEEQESK
jgi:hypothetical protein